MSPPPPTVQYESSGSISTIRLARPKRRNAFTLRMIEEIFDLLDMADHDESVRAVIVTGEGISFCAGADLTRGSRTLNDLFERITAQAPSGAHAEAMETPTVAREPAGLLNERVLAMHKPVIAAINGDAVGGGATILCAMDARVAATQARISFNFTRRGLTTEGGASWFLPRLVGMPVALDWMISGRLVPAEEATRAGFIRSCHQPDELLDAAHEVAHAFTEETSPASVALTRRLLWANSAFSTPTAAHEVESRLLWERAKSSDGAEGVQAFLERRPARFDRGVGRQIPPWLPTPWRS